MLFNASDDEEVDIDLSRRRLRKRARCDSAAPAVEVVDVEAANSLPDRVLLERQIQQQRRNLALLPVGSEEYGALYQSCKDANACLAALNGEGRDMDNRNMELTITTASESFKVSMGGGSTINDLKAEIQREKGCSMGDQDLLLPEQDAPLQDWTELNDLKFGGDDKTLFLLLNASDVEALVALSNTEGWTEPLRRHSYGWSRLISGMSIDAVKDLYLSGVTIEGNRITKLDLSRCGLRGTIPPQIGYFPKLVTLRLAGNRLVGSVPAEMGHLSSLQFLSLNKNQLCGEIPLAVGELVNLESLQLQRNKFEGPIPSTLGKLKKLRYLNLKENPLDWTKARRKRALETLLPNCGSIIA